MGKVIMDIAMSQLGIQEIKGSADNPEVLKYFNDLGFDGARLHDETSWCSAFANWVCKKAGVSYSGKLTARSWLKVGTPVAEPQQGDIVVLWRVSPNSWQGHVGFFVKQQGDQVYILGGNQNDKVSIAPFSKSRILGYRRLC